MRKRLPFLLATVGVILLAGSFLVDIAFVDEAAHAPREAGQLHETLAITVWMRTIGLFTLIIGGFLFLTRAVVRNGKE